jgi:hypothetical protein
MLASGMSKLAQVLSERIGEQTQRQMHRRWL